MQQLQILNVCDKKIRRTSLKRKEKGCEMEVERGKSDGVIKNSRRHIFCRKSREIIRFASDLHDHWTQQHPKILTACNYKQKHPITELFHIFSFAKKYDYNSI